MFQTRPAVRLVLMAVVLTAAPACVRSNAAAEPSAAAGLPTVAVAQIGRADLTQTLTVTGEFRPYEEIEVHAKVAGYLKSITVDVGDHVQAGQLLGVLEVPELQDELQQDAAAINRAQEEINRAGADLDRAKSVHEVAHLGAARLSSASTARPRLIAQQDVDEATGRDRSAEAQVATAAAALAAARQQLAFAQASQRKTTTLFGYARITAPFGGVITRRYADTGAMIQAGTASQTQARPIVQLSDTHRLRLVMPVPESAVSRIHLGRPVTLTIQSLNKSVTGSVARFADRLDSETRTMHVEVDVANPNLEIVPGMFAAASLMLNEAKDVLVAPVQALDRTPTGAQVLAVAGGRIEVREVALGLDVADRFEIRSGLSEGDLVVVGSRGQLVPGMNVSAKIAGADAAREAR